MNVSWTVEGLERYPINLRYPRELRDDPEALEQILVTAPSGAQVPLGQVAAIEFRDGPPGINRRAQGRTPGSTLTSRAATSAAGSRRAREEVADKVALPPGYTLLWSGQYEYMERARDRSCSSCRSPSC